MISKTSLQGGGGIDLFCANCGQRSARKRRILTSAAKSKFVPQAEHGASRAQRLCAVGRCSRCLLPIPHTAISHYVFLPDTTSAASSATSLHTTNSYKMILSIVLRLFMIISDRSSNRN